MLSFMCFFRFFGIGSEPIVDAAHENAMFIFLSHHGIAPMLFASSSSSSSLPSAIARQQPQNNSFGALYEVKRRL